MRGLTPVEHSLLLNAMKMCNGIGIEYDERESAAADDLVEHGRIAWEDCWICVGFQHPAITASGREALRLYPLMLAAAGAA